MQKPPLFPRAKPPAVYLDSEKRGNVFYDLTQLMANGLPTDGTNWIASNAGFSVTNNIGTLLAAAVNGSVKKAFSSVVGKTYYVTADVKSTSDKIRLSYNEGNSSYHSGGGGYERLSVVKACTNTAFNPILYDGRSSDWDNVYIKNLMVYDLTAAFGAGLEPTAATMDAILAADGTAYWDGTRKVLCNPLGKYFWQDTSGNNRHAKASNMAWINGSTISRNGAEFDGVDDSLTIADSAATRLTGGGTIIGWVYPISLGEGDNGRIVDKSTGATATNGYSFGFAAGNILRFQVNDGTATDSSAVVQLSKPQRVGVTFDATGRHIYRNGVDVTASGGDETGLPPDIAGNVCIGNRAGATDKTMYGYIDKPVICDKVYTSQEMMRDFQTTRRAKGV